MTFTPADQAAVKTFLRDLTTRAAHTVWQSALPLAAALWGASGLHLSDLATVSGDEKAYLTVGVPLVAGILSAGKTAVLAFFKSPAGIADAEAVLTNMGVEPHDQTG